MDKCVYAGRLYRYKKPRVGEGHWKETWAILDSDGNLVWFNDKSCSQEKGRLNVKSHPKQLLVGRKVKENSSGVPPPVPVEDGSENGYLAVVIKKSKKDEVNWFYCKTDADSLQWLEAFATALHKGKHFQRFLSESKKEAAADRSMDEQRMNRVGLGEDTETPADWSELWHEVLEGPEDHQDAPIEHGSHHHHKKHRSHHHKRTESKASSSVASESHHEEIVANGHTVESHLTVVADVHEESTNDGSSD